MRKMFFAALSAVALTATMGVAQAATVVTDYTFASTALPDYAPVSYDFVLAKFDSSLGTLTGVTLTLTDTAAAYLDINNNSNQTRTFSAGHSDVALTVTGPNSLSLGNTVNVTGVSGAVAAHSSTEVVGTSSTVTTGAVDLSAADFAAFLTDQNVTVSVGIADLTEGATFPNPVQVTSGGGALTSGSFEVVYTYAAVPEAAIWTMLILGFGMIGLVLRADRNNAMQRTA